MNLSLDPLIRNYLDRGWFVLPCAWHSSNKRPLIESGFYGASNDPKLVASWWRRWPRALVAIRTGKKPQGSGLAIVDVDVGNNRGFSTLGCLTGRRVVEVGVRTTSPTDKGAGAKGEAENERDPGGLRAGRGFVRRAAGDAGALTLDDMRALVAYAASLPP